LTDRPSHRITLRPCHTVGVAAAAVTLAAGDPSASCRAEPGRRWRLAARGGVCGVCGADCGRRCWPACCGVVSVSCRCWGLLADTRRLPGLGAAVLEAAERRGVDAARLGFCAVRAECRGGGRALAAAAERDTSALFDVAFIADVRSLRAGCWRRVLLPGGSDDATVGSSGDATASVAAVARGGGLPGRTVASSRPGSCLAALVVAAAATHVPPPPPPPVPPPPPRVRWLADVPADVPTASASAAARVSTAAKASSTNCGGRCRRRRAPRGGTREAIILAAWQG
jgi:hypothetical protein